MDTPSQVANIPTQPVTRMKRIVAISQPIKHSSVKVMFDEGACYGHDRSQSERLRLDENHARIYCGIECKLDFYLAANLD